MRALNLARVDVYPVQYNPGLGKIRILESITFKLTYRHADVSKTLELKTKLASPYFTSTYNEVCNFIPEPSDALITSCPATYVIVSDIMFQAALQPFIAWKTKKGFKVIEAYTNNPAVGSTTTSIKNYLMGLYNTPAPGINPTSFVLLVGDVAQIPTYNGTSGSHVTDLYYAEYTGNLIPEVFIGRFSATNTTQLQPQIDKTLEYEQYLFPTEAYLGEATMVAGADASFVTHSNGQINYGTTNYFNAAHGILSHTYLQPEPSGANYSANIISNVSNGVGYANYTAHCGTSGWADPSFEISDIAGLQNASKYPLLVGNCCLSNSFQTTCFGEELLRAANKGAIGYIGASNNSYWDEDYWWGVGFKTVALNPPYNAAHLGAYDVTFHDHGEASTSWFVTQGQMVVGGNMAVEESNSTRKTYYWEIYNLMGDPSLMVYFGIPLPVTANYVNTLLVGMTSLTVNTEQNALVALSMNGVQLATAMAGATGVVNLTFPAISNVGTANLVITKQNRKPHIGTLTVVPASGPYVVYTGSTISDPLPNGNNNGLMDYAETNKLNVSLKNVGVQQATAVNATLSTASPYVTITDNTELFGNIDPNATVTKTDAFTYTVANNVPDQTVVNFAIAATSGANTWNSSFSVIAQAPVLSIGAMTVQDNGAGCNNNGILDPGETANILIANSNTGHSSISNLLGTLAIQGASTFLTINTATSSVATLAAGASANTTFNVTASASTPIGTPVSLLYTLSGGASSQYTANSPFQLVIGLIPTYNMSNGSQTTCVGNFYDSGGASGTYNNNENFTMTFTPGTAGAKMKATFLSFATESGYDYLYIYDGPNTSSTQVAGSPFHGSTSPGTITASPGNATGALTFKFTSDVSLTYAGWSATIQCQGGGPIPTVNFTANNTTVCSGSSVTFTDNSTNTPTSWAWTFVGGTPLTSTLQNPSVTYATAGTYDVTLVATNSYGSSSLTKPAYITVNSAPVAPGTPSGNAALCVNPLNADYVTSGAASATSYVWQLTPAGAGTITGTGTTATVDWNNTFTGTAQVTVKGVNSCGQGVYSSPLDVTVSSAPTQPGTPTGLAQVCQGAPDTEYAIVSVAGATSYVWQLLPVNAGTIVGSWTYGTVAWDPGFSGQATISAKAVNECGESSFSPSLSVTVNATPTLFNMTGGGEYCEGTAGVAVGLSSSQTGVNYTLMLNGNSTGNTVTGTGSAISFGNQTQVGTYTVEASNTLNCASTMNGNAAVSMMQLPSTPGIPSGPNFVNTSITTSSDYATTGASLAATYAWTVSPSNAGTIEGSGVTATVTWSSTYVGMAVVSVEGVNQCGEGPASEGFNVEVDNNVGINNPANLSFSVYPNPSNGDVQVKWPSAVTGNATVRLINALGEVVHNQEWVINKGIAKLRFAQLSQGLYMLKIEFNNQILTSTLIISD
jgi:PKD repeat protein